MDLLTSIANEFDIPIIPLNQKVWFFRTKGGRFYDDFLHNGFIALGWDKISPELIRDTKISKDTQKEKIENLYPGEKRPGLILGQMDVFYNKMTIGDMVIIPNEGSKTISVGIIGSFTSAVDRQGDIEYPLCAYKHRRSVEWIKQVEAWQDVYLFKALRAQQTISDVTEDAKLVFRNLFPVYITGDTIHLTFQKKTTEDLNLSSNVRLQVNVLLIADEIAALYGKESFSNDITLKTAVGSPGFWEFIFPRIPVSGISIAMIVKTIIGKEKSTDGVEATGVMGILTKINELINDHYNRQKTAAETRQINANTHLIETQAAKTVAETQLILSQTAKTNAETRKLELENEQIGLLLSGKTTDEQYSEHERLIIPSGEAVTSRATKIEKCGAQVFEAAQMSGMSFDGKEIGRVS